MPTPDTALVYPGTGLFEGTVLSEGRGTTRPFEIDRRARHRLALARDARTTSHLPGVRFRETYFVPTFSKFVNQTCGGVQVHVTDPRAFDAIRTAVAMLVTAKALHPDVFALAPGQLHRQALRLRPAAHHGRRGRGVDEVIGAWQAELAEFDRDAQPYLLYR